MAQDIIGLVVEAAAHDGLSLGVEGKIVVVVVVFCRLLGRGVVGGGIRMGGGGL